MAPVPFPFNVLGDYNGACPPRCPGHQQAPTKHAHRNRWGPGVAHLERETRHSAPTMKTSQVEHKPAKARQSRQSAPAPTMESAAGRGRTASAVQNVQVGMKKTRHRPFGHALPFEWQIVVLGGAQRRPVPRFGKTAEQKGAPSRARNGRGLKVGVYRWVYPAGQTMTR